MTLRCAIYTRKSSEEGLEQTFNSLDAQREACEAHIKSQAHEGWRLIRRRFDDGGFTGANMARPGLEALLADVTAGKVDVIVVYKVDRLTRSLADFARIVDRLDAKKVSFVAVTQAFNTTSSMGRLTLNMLLSFAQFEREVTSERIRDKVAASKAKGMWMGGTPPLGYRCEQRSLVIVPAEAERVRHMFDRYLELGSVSRLVTELAAAGVRSKVYVAGQGREGRSVAFHFASLLVILRNATYLGEVHHKGVRYPGQHEAIVARSVWDAVQVRLKSRLPRGAGAGIRDGEFVLKALVFDERGRPVKLARTEKSSGQSYRYYQTSGGEEGAELIRAPAEKLEATIEQVIVERLSQAERLGWRKLPLAKRVRRIRQIVRRVEIEPKGVQLTIDTRKLDLTAPPRKRGRPNRLAPGPIIKIAVPMRFSHRASAAVLTPSSCSGTTNRAAPDRTLVAAVAKAHIWRAQIEGGKAETLDALAKAHTISAEEVERLLPLAYLSPAATSAVLEGRQGSTVTLDELLTIATARSWEDQARSLLL